VPVRQVHATALTRRVVFATHITGLPSGYLAMTREFDCRIDRIQPAFGPDRSNAVPGKDQHA